MRASLRALLLMGGALRWALLLGVGALMLLPFWWMVATSLRLEHQVYSFPPDLWPDEWHWQNYSEVLKAAPFTLYLRNTLIVASAVTLGNLLFSAMAGYAFARLEFRGRDQVFWLFLASLMIPGQVTMIPVYLLVSKLGWVDSYSGLIVPGLAGAYGVFLCRQYFLNLPADLENAARLEGAGEWQVFRHVALPLARPVLAVLGVFTFMGAWTDFLWPLLMANSQSMRTLEVGLSVFKTQYTVNWPLQMAASLLIQLPVIAMFLAAQKHFTKGIALSGMKG